MKTNYKKIKGKVLGMLLLACFAGNVDVNATNAKLQQKIDNFVINNQLNCKVLSKIASYFQVKENGDYFVQAAADKGKGQLKQLINNLINTIKKGKKDDRSKAANMLRDIILSEPNRPGMHNHRLHSAIHFKDELVNTTNALEYMLDNVKYSHTRLKNYEYDTIFSKVMSSNTLINQNTDITFAQNVGGNNNANQIKIIVPICLVCDSPKIQELYDQNRDVKDKEAKKYKIQCMINITKDGLVQKQAANTNVDGRSGSLYPMK